MNNLIKDQLLEKSKEAFVLAIELYNKPTIRYRVEGFSFFICNAWELMLKAHIINKFGESEIYYRDNPDRTITLEVCIRKIFTNEKAPLRKNLEKIIELRNTSTHFITQEYEMVYISLFQACVFNFIEKMLDFHNIDMTEIIPQNFLTLAVSMHALDENEIRAKYPGQVARKLLHYDKEIRPLVDENNSAFAIRIEHYHYITKDPNKATEIVRVDKNADSSVQIIKEMKDPNDTHKYNMKACLEQINKQLRKTSFQIRFNRYHFNLFSSYYNIKENPKMCYVHRNNKEPTYSYSQQAIDFIVEEIKKDPEHIIQNLKQKVKK